MRTFFIIVALTAMSACATLRRDNSVCPEYRGIRCVTDPECSLDTARGCRVCQCSPLFPGINGPLCAPAGASCGAGATSSPR